MAIWYDDNLVTPWTDDDLVTVWMDDPDGGPDTGGTTQGRVWASFNEYFVPVTVNLG